MTSHIIIPRDPKAWSIEVDKHLPHLPSIDISSIGQNAFGSASKLKYTDWLLLKVVWPTHQGQLTHAEVFGSQQGRELKDRAKRALADQPWMGALLARDSNPLAWSHLAPWRLSANDIDKRLPAMLDMSPGKVYDDADPFRLLVEPSDPRDRPRRNVGAPRPDYGQSSPSRQSPASSRSTKSHPASLSASPSASEGRPPSDAGSGMSGEARFINNHRPDEALINMSLILLLQGVTMTLLQSEGYEPYDWSILHKQFSVTQPDPYDKLGRRRLLTARTDGCLQASFPGQDAGNGDTLAIIEVKPYRRLQPVNNTTAVRVQEGAEMAAWISTESRRGLLPSSSTNQTYRRLLISQDFDEVFITIAEFDDLYVRYITGDSVSWPMASRRAPQDSPTKDPRPDPGSSSSSSSSSSTRSSSHADEDRGRPPQRDQKDMKKPSLFDKAFRSSSKTSLAANPPALDPSQAPPPRHRTPSRAPPGHRSASQVPPAPAHPRAPRPGPTTPERQRPSSKSQSPPQAPKQAESAVLSAGTGGFLHMHEYHGFQISDQGDMEELAYLLYSLTRYLCKGDAQLRLQFAKGRPQR